MVNAIASLLRCNHVIYWLVPEEGHIKCHVDNAGVVKQAINTTNHAQAKHHHVAQAYIRGMCDTDEVLLVQVPTEDNPPDFFTKALDRGPFEKHKLTIMGPQANPGLAAASDSARDSVAKRAAADGMD